MCYVTYVQAGGVYKLHLCGMYWTGKQRMGAPAQCRKCPAHTGKGKWQLPWQYLDMSILDTTQVVLQIKQLYSIETNPRASAGKATTLLSVLHA